MPKGTIKLISDRGFGFVRTAEGKDLFFHRKDFEGVDYDSLREGREVEFEVGRDRIGRSQAVRVRLPQEYTGVFGVPKEIRQQKSGAGCRK